MDGASTTSPGNCTSQAVSKISPTAGRHSHSCVQAPKGFTAATVVIAEKSVGGGITGSSQIRVWEQRSAQGTAPGQEVAALAPRALWSALLQPYLILYSLVCIKLNHIKAYYWTSWFNLTGVYLLLVVTLSFKIRLIKSAGQALRWRLGRKQTQNITKTWIPKQTNALFRHLREC